MTEALNGFIQSTAVAIETFTERTCIMLVPPGLWATLVYADKQQSMIPLTEPCTLGAALFVRSI